MATDAKKSSRTRKTAAAAKTTAPKRRVKVTAAKGGDKAAPAAAPKRSTRASRNQDSVTITMVRGKRDFKSREIDTDFFPQGDGGVRFEEERDNGRSPLYLPQSDYREIGEPSKIRVTVKALA